MLSYRHAFHAGNHADILKHSILSRVAISLTAKDKPFSYLETHAGAGMYYLDAEWAQKTGEAEQGILSILKRDDIPEKLLPYVALCRELWNNGHRYPGSPAVVQAFARKDDHMILMELHPAEAENLKSNLSGDPRIHIHYRDGYGGILALSPPEIRRGFALIDPSYETADDYQRTAETLIALHRRWPVGILALWYPIVARREAELSALKDRLAVSGIPGILTAELCVQEGNRTDPAREIDAESNLTADTTSGYGLLGSGMLIISPPWKLETELREYLPWLSEVLGAEGTGSWNIEWLSVSK